MWWSYKAIAEHINIDGREFMNSKVSIIMSVYNDKKFLEDAILSILQQTYKNFEFIICNDCSTDGSEKIIEKYAAQDDRIVYFKNEKNLGLAASLNVCLSKVTGVYVARMDSDDYSLEDRLQKQVAFLDENEWCAVLGGQVVYMNGENFVYDEKGSSYKIDITKTDVMKRVNVAHPTVMMRKTVVDQVGGYTVGDLTHRAEDYDLWCKIAEKGYQLHNLSDIVLKYRQDAVSIKKRKYCYRIEEFRIKNYWRKRMGYSIKYIVFAIKPLLVGLLPSSVYMKLKKIK